MAGGIKYENRYQDIEDLVIKLLRFTMSYNIDVTRNKEFIRKIRDIMVITGAKRGTGLSTLESVPDYLIMLPKTKREERGNENDIFNDRDV